MKLLLTAAFVAGILVSAPAQGGEDDWDSLDWSLGAGANTIKGSALLRTRGGDVKTCAGLPVRLLPYGSRTASYVAKAFGSDEGGISREPWRAQFGEYVRTTTCDAQGSFTFEGLPDGRYYAIAFVTWDAVSGGRYPTLAAQGGLIAQQVRVRGGQVQTITITQ